MRKMIFLKYKSRIQKILLIYRIELTIFCLIITAKKTSCCNNLNFFLAFFPNNNSIKKTLNFNLKRVDTLNIFLVLYVFYLATRSIELIDYIKSIELAKVFSGTF